MIEQYHTSAMGYHPFLIRDGWQVAQLNYTPEQAVDNIEKLDIHHLTDEAFILMKGIAVLIVADLKKEPIQFEFKLMSPNITYNIPKGTWHNIAMQKGCEVIIVEKSDTHVADFEFFSLSNAQKEELKIRVNSLLVQKQSKQ